MTSDIETLTAKANARLCASCLESHPIDVMCPPHEARTTGPQWFRERLAARDAEIAEWKRIHQAREEQAVVDRTNIHCLTEERDRLAARIAELEQAIREHRDQKADDRCWMDDQRLYAVLNDGNLGDNTTCGPGVMLENCKRFIEQRMQGGEWPSYQELERQVEELRRDSERYRWLRKMPVSERRRIGDRDCYRSGAMYDAAIDNAMKEQP